MKTTTLSSCSWGVEIHDQQIGRMTDQDLLHLGKLVLENQVVLLRNQQLTAEQEVHACYKIGDVERVTAFQRCPQNSSGDFIAEIQRVTGMKHTDGTAMGLFGHDHDLDWHANRPSAEMERKPLIWLRSVFGTKGTRTSWANCTRAYHDLPPDLQYELTALDGIFGFEPNSYTTWNEWKPHRNMQGIKIVRSVPGLAEKVLFFPFLQLFGFKNKTEAEFQKIYQLLKSHILQDKYIYHHDWQDGDVLISEQWGTIHKRWECDVSHRMLHRISFGWDNLIGASEKKTKERFL